MEAFLILSSSYVLERSLHRSLQITLICTVDIGSFDGILLVKLLNLELGNVELIGSFGGVEFGIWVFELVSSDYEYSVALLLD